MANGDPLYDANGDPLYDSNGDPIYESDDCCYYQLKLCSDDSVSAYTIRKSDVPGSAPNTVFKRDADEVCYYLGDATPCAGTDAGSGTWYDDCETCEPCEPDVMDLRHTDGVGHYISPSGPDLSTEYPVHIWTEDVAYFCRESWNELYATQDFEIDVWYEYLFSPACAPYDLYVYVNGVDVSGALAVGGPTSYHLSVLEGDRVQFYVVSSPAGCGQPGTHDMEPYKSFLQGICNCADFVSLCCPTEDMGGLPSSIVFEGHTLTRYDPGDTIPDGGGPGQLIPIGARTSPVYYYGSEDYESIVVMAVTRCGWQGSVRDYIALEQCDYFIPECDPEGDATLDGCASIGA